MFAASQLSPRARNLAAAVIHRAWGWVATTGCIGPDDALGQRFHAMGASSCIAFPPGSMFGERWIQIGPQTLIGPYVSLAAGMPGEDRHPPWPPPGGSGRRGSGRGHQSNGNGQPSAGHDDGLPPIIVIGARCSIGRGTSIVGLRHIEIGDDVAVGPNVYITDHNHSYGDVDVPILSQWPSEDPVRIGPGSWLGTGVIVLPGSDIGRNVAIAAGSIVRGSIPDYSVAAGAPAQVIRRHSARDGWVPPLRPTTVRPPS